MSQSSPPAGTTAFLSDETNSTQLDADPAQQRVLDNCNTVTTTPPNHTGTIYTHNDHNHHPSSTSPIPINEFTQSPRHVRRTMAEGDNRVVASASPVHDLMDEDSRLHAPSSPLLTAMREAVDSINQYDDFEILEKIGAGFFADVFKVQ